MPNPAEVQLSNNIFRSSSRARMLWAELYNLHKINIYIWIGYISTRGLPGLGVCYIEFEVHLRKHKHLPTCFAKFHGFPSSLAMDMTME